MAVQHRAAFWFISRTKPRPRTERNMLEVMLNCNFSNHLYTHVSMFICSALTRSGAIFCVWHSVLCFCKYRGYRRPRRVHTSHIGRTCQMKYWAFILKYWFRDKIRYPMTQLYLDGLFSSCSRFYLHTLAKLLLK